MFWAKYRGWLLLIVYIVFFGHTALWHHFGWEKVGHLGFGCIFGTMRDGVVTAGTVFTLLIFFHALFFGGIFCGWMCHWGILQDLAAWIMKKLGIKPVMAHVNSRLIPWFWFLILIGQVVLYWMYTGFPTSLSFKMDANPVWFMVPRSILMIVLTTIISGFALIFLFGERAFCRTICVFRIWFNWFERIAPHKIRQTKECSSCEGECSSNCPMGLAVVEEVKNLGHIKNPECVKCYRCVGACPHNVLAASMQKNDFHKAGAAIVPPSSLSKSIDFLQVSLAVILVIVFGFNIGGNIALSLGFLIGIIIARMLYCKSASAMELSVIVILGIAIHFRIDMNDATSTAKGLGVLAVFLLVTRLLKYDEGFAFIREKARHYRLPAAVTVVFVGIALALGVREIHASMMIHKAKAAIAQKDYPTYISAMISCADFVPNPAGAYFDLANAQLLQKDTEEALKNYQKSLEINYTDEAAMVILQKIADAGEKVGWQQMLNYLIETYPNKSNFKLLKAQNLISEQNLAEAEKYLNEILSKDPHDSAVLITLGNLRVDQNRLDEAKNLFEAAHKADPADGSVALASFYRWTEDYGNSEKYLAEAIGHFPQNPTLYVERGVNFAIQNQLPQAIESWEKALKIDPEHEAAKRNLAIAKAQLEQTTQESQPRPGPFKQTPLDGSQD